MGNYESYKTNIMPLLSVVIPVYNEKETIEKILHKINAVPIDKEIVIIDNFSTDGTREVLKKIEDSFKIKVIYHTQNLGKGTSVRDGIEAAQGEIVIIQDADLEYEPNDYISLIKPLLDNKADMVLGARFMNGHSGLFMHRLGNRFLTGLVNFLFGSGLNDYATCYKLAKRQVFNNLNLTSKGFDIEVEIVCKALKNKLKIVEVPISYYARPYVEGKKIRWLDGIQAISSILSYWIRG